ncbi:MAG: hypothetical protein WCT04_12775 [Planctomycetota bacterium]
MSALFVMKTVSRTLSARLAALCVFLLVLSWSHAAAEETPKDNRVKLHVKASDPNGGKLTFKWVQLSGPDAKILDAVASKYDDNTKKWLSDTYFIPTKAGTYTFQVTVKNEDGLESKKTYVLDAK